MDNRRKIGSIGENFALRFLLDRNFTLLEKNARMRWGEIDLIVKKKNTISFIEVKTRVGLSKGQPYEAVDYRKQRTLKRSADYYIHLHKLTEYKYSLDVIGVVLDTSLKPIEIKFYGNVIY